MNTTPAEITVESPSLMDDVILHEDDLTEEAKRQFGYHSEIFRAFELDRRSILDNDQMTRVGRHLAFSMLKNLHTDCKQVLNYMATNNELVHQILPDIGPLVICGLPRTGTTLLYNLLACDPNCRAPLFTDMFVEPVPPISRSNLIEHERRAMAGRLAAQLREKLVGRPNTVAGSHPSFAIEQDFQILCQAGLLFFFALMSSAHQVEPEAWFYDETNKDYAYDYHKTFLSMLNSVDEPRSHWLLKSPEHVFFLDTFFRHYPRATMIMTHRRLDDVLPSSCRMVWAYSNMYFDETNSTIRDLLTTRILQHCDKTIKCIVEFRIRQDQLDEQSRKNIFDVVYDDLMEQPIITVRRIYDHFNLHWSQEFEVAMNSWLRDNPQGKQGRHTYSLTEYGLSRDDIEARYADYTKLFLHSSSSNIVSTELFSTSKRLENV